MYLTLFFWTNCTNLCFGVIVKGHIKNVSEKFLSLIHVFEQTANHLLNSPLSDVSVIEESSLNICAENLFDLGIVVVCSQGSSMCLVPSTLLLWRGKGGLFRGGAWRTVLRRDWCRQPQTVNNFLYLTWSFYYYCVTLSIPTPLEHTSCTPFIMLEYRQKVHLVKSQA